MRDNLVLYVIGQLLILILAMPVLTLPQDSNRQKNNSKPTVLQQLHPDLVEKDPPEGIRLLARYKHKGGLDFEGNQVGEISNDEGVKIKYEMGFSQGLAIDPDQKATYVWYREQIIGRRLVRYALSKQNIFIISIALGSEAATLHAANFYAAIRKPEDVADVLLMILPLAYKS